MATAANKQHRLSPVGRSLWARPVCCLLLLLMAVGPASPSFAGGHLWIPAKNQPDREETEAGETATTTALREGVARSRSARADFPQTPGGSRFLQSPGSSPHAGQLTTAGLVRAFARRDGPGISMRC